MKLMFPASDKRSTVAMVSEKRPWIQQGAECKLVMVPAVTSRHTVYVHFTDCPHPREYDLVSPEFLKGKSAIPKGVRI